MKKGWFYSVTVMTPEGRVTNYHDGITTKHPYNACKALDSLRADVAEWHPSKDRIFHITAFNKV